MRWELIFSVLVPALLVAVVTESSAMPAEEKQRLRGQVKEMFHHAYSSYMNFAYPADELMPLSCKGRVRGVDPTRGDVDDALGMFSLTLVDTLDTLAVLGEVEEFEKAVKLVIKNVQFDTDIVVSVFETNIRMVGGLLGAHVAAVALKRSSQGMGWYTGELLSMAKDIGERILPAFNTSTGIPYPKVNLKYGIHHPESNTGTEVDTCTACAGTMIMEFGALSRLTGDPIFEEKAKKAMESLWRFRSRASDLVGTVINIHNGDWVRRDSGVGAGIDSYYEYCLKAYILLGDDIYLDRFNKHYKSIMQYINQGAMFLSVQMHQPERTSHAYMDALQAFWPGLQVLKGDIKKAIETHQMLYEVAKRHTFLPEAFTTDFEVHWGEHPLRPELVESTYFLYEATKDPYYLEVGKNIIEKINEHARVPCGFAALKDVRTLSHEDRMDSFVLAETFKYLYLLFTEKRDWTLHMNEFIFTTEAHLLPLSLSNISPNGTGYQQVRYNVTLNAENEHDFTCPNTASHGEGKVKYAEEVRRKMLLRNQGSCPKKTNTFAFTNNKPPRLRAEQFVPGNAEHLAILKSMGITVAHTKEGKIQLMHTASSAHSQEDAEQGIKFMQEMIELAKQRNDDSNVVHNPRVVQLMSSPYDGRIVLTAGPAQFGLDLTKGDVGVGAEVAMADPLNGCSPLVNQENTKHRIVVMQRGDCMFIDKARSAEKAGAVAVIIIDNNDGSSSDSQPIFAMAGDGTSSNVHIPAVLLFHQEGQILRRALAAQEDTGETLTVRVAAKATNTDAKKKEEEEPSEEKPKDQTDESAKEKGQVEKGKDFKKEMLQIIKHLVDEAGINKPVDTTKKSESDAHPGKEDTTSDDKSKEENMEGQSSEPGVVRLQKDQVFCAPEEGTCSEASSQRASSPDKDATRDITSTTDSLSQSTDNIDQRVSQTGSQNINSDGDSSQNILRSESQKNYFDTQVVCQKSSGNVEESQSNANMEESQSNGNAGESQSNANMEESQSNAGESQSSANMEESQSSAGERQSSANMEGSQSNAGESQSSANMEESQSNAGESQSSANTDSTLSQESHHSSEIADDTRTSQQADRTRA